jgi:hypothetical protein
LPIATPPTGAVEEGAAPDAAAAQTGAEAVKVRQARERGKAFAKERGIDTNESTDNSNPDERKNSVRDKWV